MKSFASDNYSNVAPEIMQMLIDVNQNHAAAYGEDQYTEKAIKLIGKTFKRKSKIIFVFNGTAANTISLKLAAQSQHSIFTVDSSHLVMFEVGAPMFATGAKMIALENKNGKLLPEKLKEQLQTEIFCGVHNNKPRVVSIAQPTEFGTIYTSKEIEKIADICRENNLFLHMDGCRLYNAAVALNISLEEITRHVDILSLGGTKNGLMFGEAVVIFNKALFADVDYVQKQLLQLYSKMRYLSAQFIPYFEKKLWHQYASHANKMCKRLADKISQIKKIKITHPIETNQIFACFPNEIIPTLQKEFPFYVFEEECGLIRLVTSFDTTEDDVDDFVRSLKKLVGWATKPNKKRS